MERGHGDGRPGFRALASELPAREGRGAGPSQAESPATPDAGLLQTVARCRQAEGGSAAGPRDGFRSVIFVVFPFDTEMPCLLAERVRPAVVDASERSPSHYETPRFEPDS
jgi:hypothetical protein